MSAGQGAGAKLDISCLIRHLAIATSAWLGQQMLGVVKSQCCLRSRRRRSTGGRCWRGWIGRWAKVMMANLDLRHLMGIPASATPRPRPQGAPAALLRGHQGAAPHQGPACAGARHAAAAPSGLPHSCSCAS